MKKKKFVLATKNQHKADEIRKILGEEFEIITQTEAGVGDIEVIEDGDSFEANATKKAIAIMEATNLPTIADDSGLCVDYLGGEPGIYTARYAGENATDSDNIKKLLCELEGVPPQDRNAKFVCVMAVAIPCKKIQIFRGECSGRITDEKMGESGFGYDPIFYAVQYGKTMAELEPHIKNAISHRSKACNRMAESLKKY